MAIKFCPVPRRSVVDPLDARGGGPTTTRGRPAWRAWTSGGRRSRGRRACLSCRWWRRRGAPEERPVDSKRKSAARAKGLQPPLKTFTPPPVVSFSPLRLEGRATQGGKEDRQRKGAQDGRRAGSGVTRPSTPHRPSPHLDSLRLSHHGNGGRIEDKLVIKVKFFCKKTPLKFLLSARGEFFWLTVLATMVRPLSSPPSCPFPSPYSFRLP